MSLRQFSSYSGLDRPAMLFGIPMPIVIGLLLLSIVIYFLGTHFFGVFGFLFIFVLFPIALFIRQICSKDNRAINILFIEFKYTSKRRFYKEFGNTLTFLPNRYLKNEKVIKQTFRDNINNR